MGLFSSLLQLHGSRRPEEDFFTEVVANVLSQRRALLIEWLHAINAISDPDATVDYVSTQSVYFGLEAHASDSRPDLEIGISTGRGKTRILIESKLGSSEGPEQLQRYAEILAEVPVERRVLIYCTRDYDPKAPDLGACRAPVEFLLARWHTLYAVLGAHRESSIIDEVCLFMEEHEMSQDGMFTPADLVALQRFPHTLAVVKHALWESVETKFTQVLGKRPNEGSSNAQLVQHKRYLLKADMHEKWWFGLGFFLSPTGADYPEVGGMLEVEPTSPKRGEILAAMEEVATRPGWRGSALRVEGAWSKVLMTRPLQHFLQEEHHVAALEHFFHEVLDEVTRLRSDYPHLPWRSSETDSQEAEGPEE